MQKNLLEINRKISDLDLRFNKIETMFNDKLSVDSVVIVTLQNLMDRYSLSFPLKEKEEFDSLNERLGNDVKLKGDLVRFFYLLICKNLFYFTT